MNLEEATVSSTGDHDKVGYFFNYKLHACFMHFQVYKCFIIKSVKRQRNTEAETESNTEGHGERQPDTHRERSTQRPNTFLHRVETFHTCLQEWILGDKAQH